MTEKSKRVHVRACIWNYISMITQILPKSVIGA